MRYASSTVVALLIGAALLASCKSGPRADSLRPEANFPIVFILIDALRADRIAAAVDPQAAGGDAEASKVAPVLAELGKDAVFFRNAFASAPKTIPSVPQMFTSRYFPDVHHDVTLLSVCKNAGYTSTAAFVHNPYVTKWLGRIEPTFDQLGGGDFDAKKLTDNAIAWLTARQSDRFAMYVHYLDVHMPVRPPADIAARFLDPAYRGPIGLEFGDMAGAWAGRYGADDQRRIGQLYDATVAATDAQVGRLLQALRDSGLYDRAMIIVTADHGEELWDHGGFFHGHSLYDELLHVPLMVKFPGAWAAGAKVDSLARTIDILPTITDLLSRSGAGAGPEADGASLVPVVTGEAPPRILFATVGRVDDRSPPLHAVRSASGKLILDVRSGEEMLFDLDRDPAERDNLADRPEAAALLASLRGEMEAALAPLAATGVHARVVNGTKAPVRYALDLGLTPIAPFVNLARFDAETGDRVEQRPAADGLSLSGLLEPGDHDEVRFDVLSTDATLLATLKSGEGAAPVEVCVAAEARCEMSVDGAASLPLPRLQTAAAPQPRATSSVQVQIWQVPGVSEPISPPLSPADRERLRALGYAE